MPTTDQYGNTWVDDGSGGGYWIGTGANAGQFFYGGAWHLSEPSGGGLTYKQYISDGTDGFKAGTLVQVGSNGSKNAVVTPSSGGGSTNPTNVYVSQNPGELYQTIVSDGTDGYQAGTVYQVNQLTGAVTIKSKPAAAGASLYNDANGDGYDDQTGLPVGVIRDSNSPSGYLYHGQPVNADGSLYTGGGGGGSEPKVTTIGGVPYVWDGSQFVPAPGIPLSSGPGSTPGSSGNSASGLFGSILSQLGQTSSMSSPSASISSTYGGSTDQGTRLVTGPNGAWTLVDLNTGGIINQGAGTPPSAQPISASEAAQIDIARQRLGLDQQSQAFNQQLQMAQLGLQQQSQQQSLINDFGSAMLDVNPNAVRDWLYGAGMPLTDANGGNIWNAISQGGDALNNDTATRAAGLLAMLRGQSGGGLALPGTPGASLVNGLATGGGGGEADIPSPTSSVGGSSLDARGGVAAGDSSAPSAPAPPPKFSSLPYGSTTGADQGKMRSVLVLNDANGQPLKDANGNYYLYDPNDPLGQNIRRTTGPNGESLVRYNGNGGFEAGTSQPMMINAAGQPVDASGKPIVSEYVQSLINQQANTSMSHGGLLANTYTSKASGPYSFEQVGSNGNLVYGGGYQSYDPSAPGYLAPGQTYNPGASGPTGGLATTKVLPAGDTAANPGFNFLTPPNDQKPGTTAVGIQPPPQIQVMARGGLATGPYISGDSLDNRPNPELNVPTPMGNRVIPLRNLPPQAAQQAMMHYPRHATGYNPDGSNADPRLTSAPTPTTTYPDAGPNAAPVPVPTTDTTAIPYGNDNVLRQTQPAPVVGPVNPVITPSPYVRDQAGTTSTGAIPMVPEGPGYTGGPLDTRTTSTGDMIPGIQVNGGTTSTAGGNTGGQPTTGLATTVGGTSTTVTPGEQSYLDEVLNARRTAFVPDANYLDVGWANIPPTQQAAYLKALQERYGISAEDVLAEQARMRIRGYTRGGLALAR